MEPVVPYLQNLAESGVLGTLLVVSLIANYFLFIRGDKISSAKDTQILEERKLNADLQEKRIAEAMKLLTAVEASNAKDDALLAAFQRGGNK